MKGLKHSKATRRKISKGVLASKEWYKKRTTGKRRKLTVADFHKMLRKIRKEGKIK